MDPDIEFTYEDISYTVSSRAFIFDLIILPDKRALEVYGWTESQPPSPIELHEVPHIFMNFSPEEIATQLGGVVAQVKG